MLSNKIVIHNINVEHYLINYTELWQFIYFQEIFHKNSQTIERR